MAPTKANAMYAATMLSLLSRGLARSIGMLPWVHNAARTNVKNSKAFPDEKGNLAVHRRFGDEDRVPAHG
jgi:hypothetical protein